MIVETMYSSDHTSLCVWCNRFETFNHRGPLKKTFLNHVSSYSDTKICSTATLQAQLVFLSVRLSSHLLLLHCPLTADAARYVGGNRSELPQQGCRTASWWERPSSIWMSRGQFPVAFTLLRLFFSKAWQLQEHRVCLTLTLDFPAGEATEERGCEMRISCINQWCNIPLKTVKKYKCIM